MEPDARERDADQAVIAAPAPCWPPTRPGRRIWPMRSPTDWLSTTPASAPCRKDCWCSRRSRPRAVAMTIVDVFFMPCLPRSTGQSTDCAVAGHSHALESPLYRWQHTILAHPDLYLPCGVYSLVALRQLMTVEQLTLVALSRATKDARNDVARSNLSRAQAARAARLHELRTAAAKIVSVGAYYNVRARSTRATYWGVTCGLLGIVAIIAAVAWPMK